MAQRPACRHVRRSAISSGALLRRSTPAIRLSKRRGHLRRRDDPGPHHNRARLVDRRQCLVDGKRSAREPHNASQDAGERGWRLYLAGSTRPFVAALVERGGRGPRPRSTNSIRRISHSWSNSQSAPRRRSRISASTRANAAEPRRRGRGRLTGTSAAMAPWSITTIRSPSATASVTS